MDTWTELQTDGRIDGQTAGVIQIYPPCIYTGWGIKETKQQQQQKNNRQIFCYLSHKKTQTIPTPPPPHTHTQKKERNCDQPGRGQHLKAESSAVIHIGFDGAETQIFLHDGQRVFGPLPVHQLVVLHCEPASETWHTEHTLVTQCLKRGMQNTHTHCT